MFCLIGVILCICVDLGEELFGIVSEQNLFNNNTVLVLECMHFVLHLYICKTDG